MLKIKSSPGNVIPLRDMQPLQVGRIISSGRDEGHLVIRTANDMEEANNE